MTQTLKCFLDSKRRTISLHTSASGFHNAQLLVQWHAHPTSGDRFPRTWVFCGRTLLQRFPSQFETQTESSVFTTDQWNFLRSHRGWPPLARFSPPWTWLPCALWERSVHPSQTHLRIPSPSGSLRALCSACCLQDRVATLFKSSLVPPAALKQYPGASEKDKKKKSKVLNQIRSHSQICQRVFWAFETANL